MLLMPRGFASMPFDDILPLPQITLFLFAARDVMPDFSTPIFHLYLLPYHARQHHSPFILGVTFLHPARDYFPFDDVMRR